jgi:predicted ATP-grasp superfamily ATP-dependent carboligase
VKKIILIGEISSYKAIVISRYIKNNYKDISIYSYDIKKFSKYFITRHSDKHFVINSANFEEDLKKIINNNKVDYFFPVINNSLYKLWLRKNEFSNTLDYLGDLETYNILNDKISLHQLAEHLGLMVPKRYDSIVKAKTPYVVKPTNLSSAKGVIYVKSKKDIPTDIKYDNIIIQQYVQGVGVGFSFYSNNGVIKRGYGHKRIAEYPVSGGSSTYRESYSNDKMLYIASKIVSHLNYTGFAMFEYKLTSANEIYLIEVNPRIWGSVNQGLANGANFFEDILGKTDTLINTTKREKKTYLSPLFYLSSIKYIIKLKFRPIYYFLKNLRYNSADVSPFTDPKGYISLLLRKIL